MNQAEVTQQALSILRNGNLFQWYVITLFMPVVHVSSALGEDGISQIVEILQSGWTLKIFGGVVITKCVASCTAQYSVAVVFSPFFRKSQGKTCAVGNDVIESHSKPVFICIYLVHATVSSFGFPG